MQENSSSNSDAQYNTSRRTKFLLMGLLFILNIVIRIPSIPHEKGYDSFFIHSLANSVSNFGVAHWWTNWMSVFGLYPYSYASAVPFTLSGISQLTGIRMEIAILLFCVFLGLFSIFASYSLATVLYDNFIQRFLFAFIFSLSSGTLNLTTWEITTRSQIWIFFPFLLYTVFNILKFRVKFVLLFIMIVLLLFATHHFVYLTLFYSALIIISALSYRLFKSRNKYSHIQKIQFKSINLSYMYISILFILIFLIFLYGTKWGLITSGSRYGWIITIITIIGRNVGFILPFSLSGLTYLALKKDKLMEEWATLICLLPTIIFSFNQIYGYLAVFIFAVLLGSAGLFNLIKNRGLNSKIVLTTIIIVLILNITFSTFFSHYRLGMGGGNSEWYLKEEKYQTGEWIKDNISWDKKAVSNDVGEGSRLFASYGGKPVLYLDDINNYINGFITLNESNLYKNSMFSTGFYFDNPYVLKSGSTSSDSMYNWISLNPINSEKPRDFMSSNNISYLFGDTYYTPSPLFRSLPENKNEIYTSGRMRVWMN